MTSNAFKINKKLFYLVILAAAIKFSLAVFAAVNTPQAKILVDSEGYLETARTLAATGTFGRASPDGRAEPEFLRTPGYPLFLAVFHHHLKIPLDGIILLQVLMTLLAAFICYRSAVMIDERLGFLAAVIMLFDPSIMVYSLLILTESQFMLLLSIFLYCFIVYLKTQRGAWIVASALALAAAVYTRPIGILLGVVVAGYLVAVTWRLKRQSGLLHALIFIIFVYGLIGLWFVRNHHQGGGFRFASIINVVASSHGLVGSYRSQASSGPSPAAYAVNVTSRSVLALFTKPGSMKYFGSEPLKKAGKVWGYPFVIFCSISFLYGLLTCRGQPPLLFAGCVAAYFFVVSVGGALWKEAPRFRVPIMPFIAIVAAHGWLILQQRFKTGSIAKE